MPATAKKVQGRWRVVDQSNGEIVKSKAGKAADGGGHASEAMARRQAQAINLSKKRKKGEHVPKRT